MCQLLSVYPKAQGSGRINVREKRLEASFLHKRCPLIPQLFDLGLASLLLRLFLPPGSSLKRNTAKAQRFFSDEVPPSEVQPLSKSESDVGLHDLGQMCMNQNLAILVDV